MLLLSNFSFYIYHRVFKVAVIHRYCFSFTVFALMVSLSSVRYSLRLEKGLLYQRIVNKRLARLNVIRGIINHYPSNMSCQCPTNTEETAHGYELRLAS